MARITMTCPDAPSNLGAPFNTRVEIDGRPINELLGIAIDVRPGSIPVATLEVDATSFLFDLDADFDLRPPKRDLEAIFARAIGDRLEADDRDAVVSLCSVALWDAVLDGELGVEDASITSLFETDDAGVGEA